MDPITIEGYKFSKYDIITHKQEYHNPKVDPIIRMYRIVGFIDKGSKWYIVERVWTGPCDSRYDRWEITKETIEREYELHKQPINRFYVELMNRKYNCVLDDAHALNEIRQEAMSYEFKMGKYKNAEPDPVLEYWYNLEKEEINKDLNWYVHQGK